MELLEREAELERIATAIAGSSGVVVVEGEPGIGKSALLEAGAGLARDAGARVFTARGGVLERDFGHGVARQLFEVPVRRAGPDERRRWLAGAARLAAPVLGLAPDEAGQGAEQAGGDSGTGGTGMSGAGGVGRDPAGGAIDDPAFAAQHGLHWLAVNIAADGPVALVVDDLQWSDLASLRWLVYLARRIEDVPLLVLAAWRTGEPDTPEELLAELPGERLLPGPLSLAATGELITRRLGRACDPDTARACHRGTSGNPFLLTEVAHALDEGVDLPLDAARVAGLGARTVGRHVRARLARLPAPAGEVARAAAVLEAGIAPRHLARVAGLPLDDVRDACDRLVAAHVPADRGTLEFVHPLVRAAIYDGISPARRAAAHRVAADVLDGEGAADRAAVHLLAAERAGDPGVVERLAAAADRARARGAVEEAVVLLRRALDEPPPPAARHALLVRLTQAMVLVGHEATIATARQALAVAEKPDEREAAALALAQALTYGERSEEALDVLRTTADALRERAPRHAARLDAERLSHSLMLTHVPRGTRDQALALAAEMDPESLPAQTLRAVAACLGAVRGALSAAEATDLARAALGNGRLLADPAKESPTPGFYWALQALRLGEHLDECDRWIARRWDLATAAGARLEWHVLAMHRAHVAALRGELRRPPRRPASRWPGATCPGSASSSPTRWRRSSPPWSSSGGSTRPKPRWPSTASPRGRPGRGSR